MERYYVFIALIGAAFLTLGLATGLSLDILLAWLVAINLITWLMYGYDKAIAGSKMRRVPERTLLLSALVGGTVGAWLGMRMFHHKTAKNSFQGKFWLIVGIQAAILVVYFIFIRQR